MATVVLRLMELEVAGLGVSVTARSLFHQRIDRTQAAALFRRLEGDHPEDQKIAALEARVSQQDSKLAPKNEVIAELMEENVRAKQSTGEP